MTTHKELMDSVDTAWLRMENTNNFMMIGSVLVLDEKINVALFREIIQQRLLKYDRFKQRVVEEGQKAYWSEDPYFNLDNHIHVTALPGEHTQKELQDFASDLMSTPLDFHHPLWQAHIIDDYQGGSAVIVRIHHCIADGIALVRVMLSLTDSCRSNVALDESDLPQTFSTEHKSVLQKLFEPARELIDQGRHLGHDIYNLGKDYIQHPEHLVDAAKKGVDAAEELARITAMPFDTTTALKGKLTGRKRVAWADPLDLHEVKTLGHEAHGTVNDILLTVATGAIRRFLDRHGDAVDHSDIHVAVPFNLRPLDKPIKKLGNQFGLVLVKLPVGADSPRERFDRVKEEMDKLKHSVQPYVFYGLLNLFGAGPAKLEQTALELLSKKASCVMTNVPGPKETLYLGGCKVRQPMVWVPQSGDIGVGLSILSYDDTVQFGLISDENIMANPSEVVQDFIDEFRILKGALQSQPEPEAAE